MSNPPRPPLLPAPNQWPQAPPPVPVGNPPWTYPPPPTVPPPPMVYPNTWPYRPDYPPPAPNAATPWQYPGSQDIAPPPRIPFTALPPPMPANLVPSFPPPVGLPPPLPSFPLPPPMEVCPALQAEPNFPPLAPQAISTILSFPTSESGSKTDIRLSKDPRRMAKSQRNYISDENDIKLPLLDSNEKISADNGSDTNKVQKDTQSMLLSNSNTSQESKGIRLKVSTTGEKGNFDSQDKYRDTKEQDFAKLSQFSPCHSKEILSGHSNESKLKIYGEFSHDRAKREKPGDNKVKIEDGHLSDHSSRRRKNPSPDHRDGSSRSRSCSRSRSSPDYRIGSHFRERSRSRSASPSRASPNHKSNSQFRDRASRSRSPSRSRTSLNHRASSHFRDRSSRSPSRSRAAANYRDSSHFRDRSSRSPSRSRASANYRDSSYFRDRSSRSPSHSRASPNHRASSHFRDRSSRSRNSPPRDYRDSKHDRDPSSRIKSSRYSGESKHHNDESGKSRSSRYTRDSKHMKDQSRDSRSSINQDYKNNKKFRDRSRSRSRLSDNFRDKKDHKNGSGRSGYSISKDYRGGTVNYPSIKSAKYSRKFPEDKQSRAVSQTRARDSDSDSECEKRDNHKNVKNAGTKSAASHRSKVSDYSDKKRDSPVYDSRSEKPHVTVEVSNTEKDAGNKGRGPQVVQVFTSPSSAGEKNPLNSKLPSPKVKCVDPKLKLYNEIWRKVRGKAKAQSKLSSKKSLVSSKINDKEKDKHPAETSKEKETERNSENIKKQVSPSHSTSKGKGKKGSPGKPTRKPVVHEKEGCKSSKAKKIESSDSNISNQLRSEKRDRSRERPVENEDQPSLSTEPSKWIKSTPAEHYYLKVEDSKEVVASDALKELHKKFQYELVERAARAKACRPKYDPPQRKIKLRKHKPVEAHSEKSSSSSCSEESSSEEEDTSLEELERKRRHPDRLHPELWFNDPNEMNDGPLCRCSAKARRSGIRHGIYVGEGHLPPCIPHSNNANTLYHYKICVTPVTNFLTKTPTFICHERQKYIFEGFSLFSHKPLPRLPNCKVIRFNYEYTLMYVEEKAPTHFTVAGLELFSTFLLHEILELVDLDWKAHEDTGGCPQFHFMPRFARKTEDDGKELLSLNVVMEYLLKANKLLIDERQLPEMLAYSSSKWQDLADQVKGMIVTCPGTKPSSVRVDQLDREHTESSQDTTFPVIVHFGVRPPQLSYAGNPLYQKAWRDYVKYRHLLANKPKVRYADRHKLTQKETRLQEMRMENDLKRDVTIVISSKGFYQTGLMSDVIQHAMLLPILVCHLRFHASLTKLEDKIGYKFQDRFLLQLALTHPSYRENFGTNPDHARNSLTNCGLRQPQYGDRRIHYMNTRKRGINTLINIMSRFGNQQESASRIHHNERLEFLGDAVVEFLSSIHLFYMFPDLEEGGLATYRAAIVQNQHLAVLSKKLELETFMLYAHGSDLCHDLELRHAMANCFEALMGALFLDAGIEVADKVFSNTLFPEPELKEVWMNYPLHPLQEQEPNGDRRWIESIPLLQKLNKFEEQIGIEFTHIRLLARALTHRSLGYNNLTLGSNQRLEFLGDTVLQLVASEYLYKFFPQHHEGHLSLLRSSLVNNRTQAVVCGDLGMVEYAIYPYFKVELKPKDKADLLEAFLGALYIDKDLGYCRKFCEVCFFPRLQDFIMNQDWNDPKSKLQQCCLTLRSMDGGEPDIPTYKVIECKGPTNTRVYGVAVYFQGNRLAVGEGHSIQQAEMDAAANALRKSKDLFPQLRHQKRAIERSLKQGPPKREEKKRSKRKAKER